MRRGSSPLIVGIAALTLACSPEPTVSRPSSGPPPAGADLRAPESFDGIADRTERSRAIFLEASRVMLHPRCKNCHPTGDTPFQGDEAQPHDPPVWRGPEDRGIPALGCMSCHQNENLELARVPGAPKWQLAPKSMAWMGKTPGELCAQVSDPARNGGRSLAQIVDHATHDPIVAWGWSPGHGRTPAPGTQERFGALVAAWVQTGAACPVEGEGAR
jgi:hypothetical protein